MKIWLPAIRGGGGTDVYTHRLCTSLRKYGLEAEITWFPFQYQFAPHFLRSASPPHGTTVIHANSWNGFAFKRPGIPLVITEHLNVLDPSYRPYKSRAQILYHEALIKRFVLASFQEASAVTTVSQFTADSLVKTIGVRSVHVIHNWIDTSTFCPYDNALNEADCPFRLLFVGNPTIRKGADLLAPIMQQLGAQFELHITSSALHKRYRIPQETNMKMIGRLVHDSELVKAYQHCQALLFPSRLEGFGLVALEAMACGKPVIASRSSALPELVEHGVTGILCAPDDVGQFVSACRKLAGDPRARGSFGQKGRYRALNLFSEQRIVPQYIDLYKTVAAH